MTNKTTQEFKSQKKIIEEILEQDARARNCDKWLTYKLLSKYTKVYIPFEDFEKIPAFANAQKIRQHIQNKEGRLLPSDPAVLKRRRIRGKELRAGIHSI